MDPLGIRLLGPWSNEPKLSFFLGPPRIVLFWENNRLQGGPGSYHEPGLAVTGTLELTGTSRASGWEAETLPPRAVAFVLRFPLPLTAKRLWATCNGN